MKIYQFGFNNSVGKVPPGLPTLDCRVIPNPHHLRDAVAKRLAVRSSPFFTPLVMQGVEMLAANSKIAVGCAYGHDRSGQVAQAIMMAMAEKGIYVQIEKLSKGA